MDLSVLHYGGNGFLMLIQILVLHTFDTPDSRGLQ
jgi:hypothetical protein